MGSSHEDPAATRDRRLLATDLCSAACAHSCSPVLAVLWIREVDPERESGGEGGYREANARKGGVQNVCVSVGEYSRECGEQEG